MVNISHPAYLAFFQNEIKTLKYLMEDSHIASHLSVLTNQASRFYNIYNYLGDDRLQTTPFIFECCIELVIEKRIKRVVIEAQAQPDYSEVSYQLSICQPESEAEPHLLRKFHFDYALPIMGEDPKPIYHLQYGGKATPGLNELRIDVDNLFKWLSVPRLNGAPMNLALLFDLIFVEFPSEVTHKAKEDSSWRVLIKDNEELILKPYYSGIASFLNDQHKPTKLLRDFNYGN